MKKLTLDVTGMGCEGCAAAVRGALENVGGVRRAEVSLEDGNAWVLAENAVAASDLVEAVEASGYGASAGA